MSYNNHYNHNLDSYNGRRHAHDLTSPLLTKIQKACSLSLREPDLSLNLQIADMINETQGSYPRDACITLVKLINCRDLHTSLFAIALLDVIVKNCGYPVHLQISRKEFLNELVKRFPDQPPIRYSNVLKLILTAIEEWYQTFAKHGDYKKDMGYIRDMHRLLKFKGYSFLKIDSKDLAVLRPQKQLKTVKEYLKEQDIKQAAKLEELIRCGTPEDLLEANKLMKIMAGFKQDNLIEAKKLMNHELNKLRDQANLFKELLNKSESNDTQQIEIMNRLYSNLKSAQPKLIKIIEEEQQQEDDKLVQNVSSFNRYVEDLLNQYKVSKGEQAETTPKIINQSLISQEINLIDFDAEPSQSPSPSPSPEIKKDTVTQQTDLLSDILSIEDTTKPTQQEQIVDLLEDFNNLDLSKNVSTSKNFGMNGNIQLGTTIPATPIVTNDTIRGIIPESTNDILSLNETSSSSSSETFPLFSPEQQTQSRILVNKSQSTQIDLIQTKLSTDSIKLNIMVSNYNPFPISNVTLSIAVPKTISLQLDTQSTTSIKSTTTDGLTQVATLKDISNNGNKPLKIKWKLNYTTNDSLPIEQTDVFTLPRI
ncbi:hypothetical protein C6P45_001385 [Maudiozyma exigua]|uniref:VHS domain-containing protein n=1 Tax=Maudiozyma exigua TaxID=34358 RepID=A0A9P6W0N5_MAUEX|nr:hypothetical protein C6P45_001385 [Kazachstania exigua]